MINIRTKRQIYVPFEVKTKVQKESIVVKQTVQKKLNLRHGSTSLVENEDPSILAKLVEDTPVSHAG